MEQSEMQVVECIVKFNYENEVWQVRFTPGGRRVPCAIFFQAAERQAARSGLDENSMTQLPSTSPDWSELTGVIIENTHEPARHAPFLGGTICWHDCRTCDWFCMLP